MLPYHNSTGSQYIFKIPTSYTLMSSGESGKPVYGHPELVSGLKIKGKRQKNEKFEAYDWLLGAPTCPFHNKTWFFHNQSIDLDQTNPKKPLTFKLVHWLGGNSQSSATCLKFVGCRSKVPLLERTFWSVSRARVDQNAFFWSRWKRNCKIYVW